MPLATKHKKDNSKAINLWVSRVIPLVLVGIVAYVTWTVTVEIAVKYLLYPAPGLTHSRHGAAIAVLFFYYLLLLLMAVCYLRLFQVVLLDPGYVERSEQYYKNKRAKRKEKDENEKEKPRTRRKHRRHRSHREPDPEKKEHGVTAFAYSGSNVAASDTTQDRRPSLQEFFKRDVFVCQGDGRPYWCDPCQNWKPDRAHHCREVGRCVRKMDHFCPWVGGVVSETSFKFFTQFVFWTAVYCIFNLVLTAVLIADRARHSWDVNAHWIVTLAFAGLFALFTAGMFGTSLQFVLINSSTIENLSRKQIVYQVAVQLTHTPEKQLLPFHTITFSTAQQQSDHVQQRDEEHDMSGMKTYAILRTKPGENPWDLGYWANFKSVMGERAYDWFLPIHYSPCCDHDAHEGSFAMGPVLQRLKVEAGLAPPESMPASTRRPESLAAGQEHVRDHHTHRRRRRSSRRRRRCRWPRGNDNDDPAEKQEQAETTPNAQTEQPKTPVAAPTSASTSDLAASSPESGKST